MFVRFVYSPQHGYVYKHIYIYSWALDLRRVLIKNLIFQPDRIYFEPARGPPPIQIGKVYCALKMDFESNL